MYAMNENLKSGVLNRSIELDWLFYQQALSSHPVATTTKQARDPLQLSRNVLELMGPTPDLLISYWLNSANVGG